MSAPQFALFSEEALICDKCGGASPNAHVHGMNHWPMRSGHCVSQSLVLAHIESARRDNDLSRLAHSIQRAQDLRLTEKDYTP